MLICNSRATKVMISNISGTSRWGHLLSSSRSCTFQYLFRLRFLTCRYRSHRCQSRCLSFTHPRRTTVALSSTSHRPNSKQLQWPRCTRRARPSRSSWPRTTPTTSTVLNSTISKSYRSCKNNCSHTSNNIRRKKGTVSAAKTADITAIDDDYILTY